MTHPSHQTNGASLEDCHTNFFALVSDRKRARDSSAERERYSTSEARRWILVDLTPDA